jgi:predicted site-specific integrase-resolvase
MQSKADEWVATWGEAVNKVEAAQMLGICVRQVYNWINRGYLVLSPDPDNRVLVREACEFMHGRKAKSAKMRLAR